jgi:hypothetical protein
MAADIEQPARGRVLALQITGGNKLKRGPGEHSDKR